MTTSRCIFAAHIQIDTGYTYGLHKHAYTEIIYYLKGTGHLIQDKKRFSYQPGLIAVYQPGMIHNDIPNSSGIQLCIGASGCGAGKLPAGMWQTADSIDQCARLILDEISKPTENSNQERLDILTGWIVLELRRITEDKKQKKAPLNHADKIKQILDSRFNEQIDLQKIAGDLYINSDYMRHIFKQSLGESPLNYLIRKRLDSACELLNFTNLPIGDIARRVGLDNVYYFSRIFRKRLKMTPTEYRKQKRERNI